MDINTKRAEILAKNFCNMFIKFMSLNISEFVAAILLKKQKQKQWTKKMPERWRALPRHALFVSILSQMSSNDVKTSCCDVTWRHGSRDITPWRHTTSYVITKRLCPIYTGHTPPNFASVSQTVQPWECWLTDGHTQAGPILYPRPLMWEGMICNKP